MGRRPAVAAAGSPRVGHRLALACRAVPSRPPRRRPLPPAGGFGPKGFASGVYGLLAAQSGIAEADTVFELVALAIAVSIVAHSMSDVPVSRAFDVEPLAGLPDDDQPDRPATADVEAATDHHTERDAQR